MQWPSHYKSLHRVLYILFRFPPANISFKSSYSSCRSKRPESTSLTSFALAALAKVAAAVLHRRHASEKQGSLMPSVVLVIMYRQPTSRTCFAFSKNKYCHKHKITNYAFPTPRRAVVMAAVRNVVAPKPQLLQCVTPCQCSMPALDLRSFSCQ